MSQTREKQAVTLSEVSWRGRSMAVKNEHVRSFLLNIQESEKEIEAAQGIENKVSVYESLIKECIDALQILRDSLQEDQVCIPLTDYSVNKCRPLHQVCSVG